MKTVHFTIRINRERVVVIVIGVCVVVVNNDVKKEEDIDKDCRV